MTSADRFPVGRTSADRFPVGRTSAHRFPVGRTSAHRFPVGGKKREVTTATMRLAVGAITDGDNRRAATILDQVQPESTDGSAATVGGCIEVALGLLDQWLSGRDTDVPADLSKVTRLPARPWTGRRAATDILALARKGRALSSFDALITRQGDHDVLYGSALTLAAALQAWSRHTGTPTFDLVRDALG